METVPVLLRTNMSRAMATVALLSAMRPASVVKFALLALNTRETPMAPTPVVSKTTSAQMAWQNASAADAMKLAWMDPPVRAKMPGADTSVRKTSPDRDEASRRKPCALLHFTAGETLGLRLNWM